MKKNKLTTFRMKNFDHLHTQSEKAMRNNEVVKAQEEFKLQCMVSFFNQQRLV